jgi:hypothetical protein
METTVFARMETTVFRKCDRCGRAKTTTLVTFKQHISFVFKCEQKEFSGWLCFRCMTRTFVKFELYTIFGIIGCLLAPMFIRGGIIRFLLGPIFILLNIDEYISGSFLIIRAAVSLRRRTGKEPQRRSNQSPEPFTLTPRQEELVKKFFVAISLLDQAGGRFKSDKAKRILYNCVTTDIIKPHELDDLTKCDKVIMEKQKSVFRKLSRYCAYEKQSNRFSSLVAICIFLVALYQIFELRWLWGLGALVLVPIGKFTSQLIFSLLFTPGFSPLALGLTHTECRFACDEIVGHPRWND